MVDYHVGVVAVCLLVQVAAFSSDKEEPTCLSRFDHDYKVLQKLVMLEQQQAELRETITKQQDVISKMELNHKSAVSTTDCPDRWLAYEGSCYLFGHDGVHFTEAEQFCRQHGGHLVTVETPEENTFLKDFLTDFKAADYWLGMTDETTEGIWKWFETDDTVTFTDWAPSEPQNAGNEDCAVFGDPTYMWADVKCTTNRKPLCEARNGDEGGNESG